MVRKSVVLVLLVQFLAHSVGTVLAAGGGASFEDEIRLSCEKYAQEDGIPPKEVTQYIEQCVRDFNEPQSTDEVYPSLGDDGIESLPSMNQVSSPGKGKPSSSAR